MQKKRCRIYAGLPLTCFAVPIIGETELNLTPDEIYKCLCSKAEVIEILPDGSHINLDFTNYNKDNRKEEIKETTNVIINTPVTEKTTSEFTNTVSTGETTESTSDIIEEDKDVEDYVETEEEVVLEVEDEVQIQEEIKEIEEDVETEEETESTVDEEVVETTPAPVKATTVAEYQVASRNNNNNYKKAKNKK